MQGHQAGASCRRLLRQSSSAAFCGTSTGRESGSEDADCIGGGGIASRTLLGQPTRSYVYCSQCRGSRGGFGTVGYTAVDKTRVRGAHRALSFPYFEHFYE